MAKNANTQKNLYRTIDSDANDRYDDPFHYTQPGKPANDQGNVVGFPTNKRVSNAIVQYQYKEQPKKPDNLPTPPTPKIPQVIKNQNVGYIQNKASALTKGYTVAAWNISWTAIVFVFIQQYLALFYTVTFFVWMAIQSSETFITAEGVVVGAAEFFGISVPDSTDLLGFSAIILAFLSGITYCCSLLIYKIAGIHALGGKMAGLKIATFLFGFIFSCLPLLSLLPWIVVWHLIVGRNPT